VPRFAFAPAHYEDDFPAIRLARGASVKVSKRLQGLQPQAPGGKLA
jgi:hypothetical protein